VFSLTLDLLGWVIAAALLFWCVARGFGSTKPLASLVVGFTLSSLAYIAFDMALGMSLPSGILGGI
jgi:putative tricarboxylic transport membrane protein